MVRHWVPVLMILVCPLLFSGFGDDPSAQNDPAAKLLGDWVLAGKYGKGDGEASFKTDKTYSLTERHPDGIAVTRTGQFRIDASKEPWAIDLCVGPCGAAGSEWTTTFGILRFLADDEAEIHFDPNGRRPGSFDAAAVENTHRLTRKAPLGSWIIQVRSTPC